jgi:chromosome segregation ATPase
MVKVLVKETSQKTVQTALVSGLKREIRQLNADDYNYGDIMANASLFQTYAKLLGQKLGMNIDVKFDVQHTSKNKLDLINSSGPLNIKDINSAFRQNYNLFTELTAQISAIYENTYNSYIKLRIFYNMESDGYEPALDKLKDDINELTELLKKNDIIKPEDITKALEEAEARTEQDIKETEENANTTAQAVWDTNKGYETSSQIQEDAMKAAEEYAKNSALAHEAAEANNELSKAKGELQDAISAKDDAQRAWDDAMKSATDALAESKEKDKTARADTLHETGLDEAIKNTKDYDYTKTTVGGLTAGTFLSSDGSVITEVTHNSNGTTTINVTDLSSPNNHTSKTYSDTDSAQSTYDTAKDTATQSRAEADEAKANAEQKADKLKEATNNLEKATEEAINAESKVDKAQIEAEKAEANVPDVNRDPSKGESSSDGGKAKEQAEKSMEENRGKNGMPSNL